MTPLANWRRGWTLLLAVVMILVLFDSPAVAHSGSSVEPTNYLTTLESVTPPFVDARLRVVELGDQLELSNPGPVEVTVLGYDAEPYLRVGPDGVWQNVNSPSLHLNATEDGTAPIPDYADAKKLPEWQRIGTGNIATWHDHRTHWMSPLDPPAVRDAPDESHTIIDPWQVQFRQDDNLVTAVGDVKWVPAPSPVPWLAAFLGALVLAVLSVLCFKRKVLRKWPTFVLVALLLAASIFHTAGMLAALSGSYSARVSTGLAIVLPAALAWVAVGIGLHKRFRDQPGAAWFLLFAAGILFLGSGVANFADFSSSQVLFAWGANLDRLLVFVATLASVLLALGAVFELRSRRAFAALAASPSQKHGAHGTS